MTGKEAYKRFTPNGAKWVDWVRPVPFIYDEFINLKAYNFSSEIVEYIDEAKDDTALIIDLPDFKSIEEGLTLARMGYRLIPLYNGTNEQERAIPLIDNHGIENALRWASSELKEVKTKLNAPPAFLLDSNRLHRFKFSVSVFDNSWDIYFQDFPSAEYFLNNGIKKIVVRGEKINKDLKRILYIFQKKGISIYFTNGYTYPKKIILRKSFKKNWVL